jgi:hypothetical protein
MSVVHWLAEDAYREVNDLPAPRAELTFQRDKFLRRRLRTERRSRSESAARNK